MSIKLMAKVWELDVSHPRRLVLLSLADHADDAGRSVRPSVAYTAWKTGYKTRQVRNIMRDLRYLGALVVVRPAGQHRPIEYRLQLEALPVKAPFPRRAEIAAMESAEASLEPSSAKQKGVRGANSDSRGAIHDTRPAIAIAPKSFSTESSDESSGRDPFLSHNGNALHAQDLSPKQRSAVVRWVEMIARAPVELREKRTEEALRTLQRVLGHRGREAVERIMLEVAKGGELRSAPGRRAQKGDHTC